MPSHLPPRLFSFLNKNTWFIFYFCALFTTAGIAVAAAVKSTALEIVWTMCGLVASAVLLALHSPPRKDSMSFRTMCYLTTIGAQSVSAGH